MKKIEYRGNNNVVGRQLQLYRKKAKLSQKDLAARLQVMQVNMDQQMISRIERNERIVTDYELACLCMILKTTPQEMLADFYSSLEE